jgi:CDI toxin RNase A-like protein
MKAVRPPLFLIVAAVLVLAVSGSGSSGSPQAAIAASAPASGPSAGQLPSTSGEGISVRDLSVDESMGGHTLARHVGKTDAELADRLRREPQISSASTYTDRGTAERAVGAALAFAGGRLSAWQNRTGRRPNLVIHFVDRAKQPLGRSLSRGRQASVPCDRALVVLRWDERFDRFYVLTSYPEAGR